MIVKLRLAVDRARWWGKPGLLIVTVGLLLAGLGFWWIGVLGGANVAWASGTVIALLPALGWMAHALWRGHAGVDIIAVLALGGTLAVQEFLAGALVGVMLATGQTLDSLAQRRARRDVQALLQRVPRTAHRHGAEGVETVNLDEVRRGDMLLVGPGEVVPVDGQVSGMALLDESALTGEPAPVERGHDGPVRSGVINAGTTFDLQATANAEESTYAGIVRLARNASADRAPMVRLADRYAMWFLPLAVLVAGCGWLITGQPVGAVAVLVVATPCPLVLAVPVAIVSGMSRASRVNVVIRDGVALENLGRVRTAVLDKTGTLTGGAPTVTDVVPAPGHAPAAVVRLAASLEQVSAHVLAEAIVAHAGQRGETLSTPSRVAELAGRGLSGMVGYYRVEVGRLTLPEHRPAWVDAVLNRAMLDSANVAWVSCDGELIGALLLRDPVRSDAPRTLQRLRGAGLQRLVMLTGDRLEPAREIGTVLGLDEIRAEQTPVSKVASVRAECEETPTAMIGDGLNDAPALAVATVGVAMGARGSSASSEAADVVLTADRIDRLADAILVARRARRIALQSAGIGMGLSLAAMLVAAFGILPPAPGALLQEGIDVAVIGNALRALSGGHREITIPSGTEKMMARFSAEHENLADGLQIIRNAADLVVADRGNGAALEGVRHVCDFLRAELLPHERAEDSQLYPALARPLGSRAATATMSRMHTEIERLSNRIEKHLMVADSHGGIAREQRDDLLATLYGLHAVLRLHFAQEEEHYFALANGHRKIRYHAE